MNADVIKDFLISLGFQVDESGARKFDATIANTTLQAVKLGAAVEAAALSVVAYTAKIASGLDNLYWASQRTGATVAGIQQIGFAVSQLGGTVAGARSSLESLAHFMRNNPGAEGFLNRLGVQTRDAQGNMRDMASIFTGVGDKLGNMPYYRANQYAQMLGIDENTLMAMRRGVGQFSAQYTQMAKAIGYNADAAAVSSNRFMTSLRSFGEMAGMAQDKIGSNLAGGLAGSIDTLRKQVIDNFPKIEAALTGGIKLILWLADSVGKVVFRLIEAAGDIRDWWGTLDKSTRQLIEIFGALMIAWKLLNIAFLTSPVGIVTALGLAIFALYDDYKVWKEGGKSLIDWKKWQPDIDAALKAIKELRSSIRDAGDKVARLLNIDLKNWTLKGDIASLTKQFGEFGKMLSMIGDLLSAINEGRWSDAARIGSQILHQGKENSDALPAVSSSANNAADWVKSKTGFDPRSIGQVVGGLFGGNLPDRNNNPGNLRPVGGGGFRTFDNALEGWGAMRNQLMRYFTGKTTGKALQTITDIVSTWAPSSENDTGKYISDISKWMGVSPDVALNLNNPQVMTSLMQSMARKEGFSNWNSQLAGQAAGASMHQETVINIHGVSDPREAGNIIADKQNQVAARATQQMNRGN
ncbi:hypothetical protein CG428_02375 [Pantoea ananatis]|uniref:hypothetical protein n=1 Tax=Pantoea ananas TaxID=553 RepID=UPI000CF38413|nr:hypothetical protein [Pantoea ananatis]PQK80225.1 hypothetical protein CG428_02375 [Pantoea ananatis]